MAIWKALFHAGGRPVGLREVQRVSTEQGVPVFPSDAPDTSSYVAELQVKGAKLARQYTKKPPAKRVNYVKVSLSLCLLPSSRSELKRCLSLLLEAAH